MDKIVTMFKLIYRSMKIFKRIKRLQNIQLRLLKEMSNQVELYVKDKDLPVGTQLFKSNDCISEYIKVLEKNIEIIEEKMKGLLN